jgi:N-acetylglucosamine malate deacetylase 1
MNDSLDVMAVGAHPDDVEIGCGGIVAELARQGHRVGIVDLTDGEPTPGSPGPEVRLAEAQEAARTLGVQTRITLELPNRCLFDSFESRVALAKVFRRHRPRLVLVLGAKTPQASPDHYQAQLITEAAVFYSRLTKWDDQFDGLPPHTVPAFLYYYLAFRALSPTHAEGLVVDVSASLERKIAAIACYRTQFAHRPELLDRIRTFAQQQGLAAGFAAGEVVSHPGVWGTRDLMGLVFPPAAASPVTRPNAPAG